MKARFASPLVLSSAALALVVVACGDDDTTTSGSGGSGGTTTTTTSTTTATGTSTSSGMGGDMGPMCGDGNVEGGEACDDGNTMAGDGCDASCGVESGFTCNGNPSVCTPNCGDGAVVGSEGCDDGNTEAGDGCDASCAVENGFSCTGMPSDCDPVCGDGIVIGFQGGGGMGGGGMGGGGGAGGAGGIGGAGGAGGAGGIGGAGGAGGIGGAGGAGGAGGGAPFEACDDGNTTAGDGCDATCNVEPGWDCDGMPTVCTSICGDGLMVGAEGCDDGDQDNNDNCPDGPNGTCQAATCGDGFIFDDTVDGGNEVCDDANMMDGDGCSMACAVEANYCCGGEPSVCGMPTVQTETVTGLALSVPDNGYDGTLGSMACASIPVVSSNPVCDLDVTIGLDHTWIGDVTIKVVSPSNTVTTILSRPGFVETADDGNGCCGDSSNTLATSPLTFINGAATSAEAMGSGALDSSGVICQDDALCSYDPAPGAGPGVNLADFSGEPANGTWQVCVGDSVGGDPGTIDSVTLNFH